MLYAGIDIQKRVFQVVVLDPESGELAESRFEPSRQKLGKWAREWQGRLAAVAIEATIGWRWVARELEQRGFEVHRSAGICCVTKHWELSWRPGVATRASASTTVAALGSKRIASSTAYVSAAGGTGESPRG